MTSIATPRVRALLIGAALSAGCTIEPISQRPIDAAELAIASALEANALESTDLALAREKLALARRWADAKDYGPATWLAQQAEVDSELARLKAMSIRARAAAVEATDEFRRIRAATKRPS
jgi:hypothetical protein